MIKLTSLALGILLSLALAGTALAAPFTKEGIVRVSGNTFECYVVLKAPQWSRKNDATLWALAQWTHDNVPAAVGHPVGDIMAVIVKRTEAQYPGTFPRVTIAKDGTVTPQTRTALDLVQGKLYLVPATCEQAANWDKLADRTRKAMPDAASMLAHLTERFDAFEKGAASKADLASFKAEVEPKLAELNRLTGPASPLSQAVGALNLRLSALEQGALTSELGAEIYDMIEESLLDLRKDLEALKGRVTGAEQAIATIDGRLAAIESRVTGLEARAMANETRDNRQDSDLDALKNRLEQLEQRVNSPAPAAGRP